MAALAPSGSYAALKGLIKPQGPYKALGPLWRPLRALEGPYEPYKALKDLIRPLRPL